MKGKNRHRYQKKALQKAFAIFLGILTMTVMACSSSEPDAPTGQSELPETPTEPEPELATATAATDVDDDIDDLLKDL